MKTFALYFATPTYTGIAVMASEEADDIQDAIFLFEQYWPENYQAKGYGELRGCNAVLIQQEIQVVKMEAK